jgi:transposase
MPHKKGTDRNQLYLLPPSLEDFITEDNPVRIIEAFVNTLDFEKLQFKKIRTKEIGCRPYHPGDLLKLYIYGYSNRIRTSRKLEWECIRNVELMWLMQNLQPSARTIAYFRSDNKRALKLAFRQFITLTVKWDLVEGELLASDGSKLRAVNSKKNNYSENKIAFHFQRIDEKITEYLKDLDHQDKMESGIQKENVNKTLQELKERRRKYEDLQKKMKDSGADQISSTDDEARLLMIRGQITEVSYNVQTTVDSKHNLVIDVKAINTNDKKMACEMGRRAKAITGKKDFDHLMDKGYHDGETISKCQEHGLRTLISEPSASRSSDIPTPEFYNDKFIYNKQNDSYTCPSGSILKTNGREYKIKSWSGYSLVKQYKTRDCSSCASHGQCTKSPKNRGRIIQRSLYQDAVDLNNQRVMLEKEKYRKRQEMVEHPFGIIKRQWGYDHVLMKGIDKVEAESNLIFLCYNLKRVVKILGFKEFMRRLLAASLFLLKNGFIRRKISFQNLLELDFHLYKPLKLDFLYCI